MSIPELEEICLNGEDKSIRRKIFLSRARLNKLPKYEGDRKFSGWARCVTVCSKCGDLQGYAAIKNSKCWCSMCGKITLWKPIFRI